jgi:hypothetical protein
VRRSPEYWRIGGAAAALKVVGDRGYDAVRTANAAARRLVGRSGLDRVRREGTFTP